MDEVWHGVALIASGLFVSLFTRVNPVSPLSSPYARIELPDFVCKFHIKKYIHRVLITSCAGTTLATQRNKLLTNVAVVVHVAVVVPTRARLPV